MEKKKSNLKSLCCNEKVTIVMTKDFYGDNPDKMEIGTCHYQCNKCKKACDIFVKNRIKINMNTSTKVKGDDRAKIKDRQTKKEIKENS